MRMRVRLLAQPLMLLAQLLMWMRMQKWRLRGQKKKMMMVVLLQEMMMMKRRMCWPIDADEFDSN